ncbi:MAG TPA: hypothetical protein VKB38_04100 [Terracidiphilus sp.]|nr:hypothetical protein [Terracidiphilus sp.]
MKGLKWALGAPAAAVLLTIATGLAGCKGFWDPPASSGTGGTGSGAASGVFYVLNSGTQKLAGFSFASGATTPTAVTGTPVTLGAAPLSMAVAPTGGFLYVSTGGGIVAFSIGSGGTPTLLNNGQVISSDIPTAMAVDETGTWLLESTSGTGVLDAIPVSTTTGLVDSTRTEQPVNLPNTDVNQIALSTSGTATPRVFVAMGSGGTAVIPFTASGANANPFGVVSVIATKNTTGAAAAVAVDPNERLLYVGETVAITGNNVTQTGGLRVFPIGASGIGTEVSGSPYSTGGIGPSAILATANYVYVANKTVSGQTPGNITGYPVSSTGGVYSLGTLINTVNAGDSTVGLAMDSTSTYVLAVNSSGSPDLSTFTFDKTTPGKLDAGATAATGTDPVQATAIVAVP